jgi:glutamate-1-semialdehyde 2,1-aminomutase
LTAPFNDIERTREIISENADDLACIIVEPMMRSLTPETNFLPSLREVCDEQNILLIFDEVVTGFRLAWGGAQEKYGVEPDLATLGKVVGGGTPVGMVCGRADIMDAIDPDYEDEDSPVEVGGTLNGNPLGMAAGLATLNVLDRTDPYDDLYNYGSRLSNMFEEVLNDASIPNTTIGEGPVVDYVINDGSDITTWRDYLDCDSETKTEIDSILFEKGVWKTIGGKCYVSTAHGNEEFDRTAEAFKEAVSLVDNH